MISLNPSALIMTFAPLGPALAIGLIGYSAMSAISRNPEASGKIERAMIIAIAFAEAIAIYALVVALLLHFSS